LVLMPTVLRMDKKTFDTMYAKAVEAAELADQVEPRAQTARYDANSHRLIIELRSGVTVLVPCSLIQGLSDAPPEDIAKVKIVARGEDLHWPTLDVQVSVPRLMAGVFGTRKWMAGIERRGSKVKSKKTEPSRINNQRGGRPKKVSA
jgi:hypothetical protein